LGFDRYLHEGKEPKKYFQVLFLCLSLTYLGAPPGAGPLGAPAVGPGAGAPPGAGPLGAPAAGAVVPPAGAWAKTVEAENRSPSKDIANFEGIFEGIFSSFKNYK
jgi:hypothetical protein